MHTLKDIVGHVLQCEQLQGDIEKDNVAHAYLFSGPEHVGKHTLARNFAAELLLQDVPEDRRDATLHAIENLTHADLFVLDMLWTDGDNDDWDRIAKYSNVPQVHRKKARAKTDVIGIDDVRALHERLHETGTGTFRCCIITSVERMQAEAANAFLKLLEEPPEGLVFLLTTQAQSSLLPTVVSRARVVPFRGVSPADMRPLLAHMSEDDQSFILHIAAGAPGMAIALRDDPDLLRMHRTVHGTARSFWSQNSVAGRMRTLVPLHKRGQEADDLLLHLGLTLREYGNDNLRFVQAYQRLVSDLNTNAHRQLLSQRFALELAKD